MKKNFKVLIGTTLVSSMLLAGVIFIPWKSSLAKESNLNELKDYNANAKEILEEKENKTIKQDVQIETKKEEVKKEETKKETTKNATTTINKKTTTTKKVSKLTQIKNDKSRLGTYGRIYISSYDAAVYDYNVNRTSKDDLQTIVDNKDSAAYYKLHGKYVIADHNYHGLKILVNLKVGSKAYIKLNNGKILTYKMTKKSVGKNTGPDLVDKNGKSFFDMDSDLIIYTCYNNGIMGTLWELQ